MTIHNTQEKNVIKWGPEASASLATP